jgi:large subunit ribosomal protein L14
MIQPQTCLEVADNSGATKLQCIRVIGCNKNYGSVGDIIIGVVKEALPNLTVGRSDIVRAVIVRTKQTINRKDGSHLCFDNNASVLIDKAGSPIGTRIFGPLAREVKEKGFTKIVSLALDLL